MIPIDFGDMILRNPRASRRAPSQVRRSSRFAPRHELLEPRITPTTNIAITGASVVSTSGATLTKINVGETVDIKVTFTTTGLPASAQYSINYQVNGLILNSGPITSGAGGSGTATFSDVSGTFADDFTTTPGANQVIVTVDPDQSVAESSFSDNSLSFAFNAVSPDIGYISYNSAQMRQAYGVSSIPNFGSATADGSGQTIAIVDAYNDPTALSDLDLFDQSMALSTTSSSSLYQLYGPASSFLNVYNQAGVNITSQIANSGTGGVTTEAPDDWYIEISLDVDWAHSIAPGAKIDLVEANTASNDLDISDQTAANLPGVSVVSNSWGSIEYDQELADDANFLTPSGHSGVTFLASTGDSGAPGGYPAYSPNIIAIGGTELTLAGNSYGSETGWSYPTPTTVSHSSSGYSQSGNWSTQSGGFSGSYSTAVGGSSASATWTTTAVTGNDEVSATWTANAANATNATYTIYDGTAASGAVIGQVTVDQTKAPVGTPDGNSKFQDLGVFGSGTGTLTVVLDASSANGKVVADAIGTADASAGGGGISQFESEPSYQMAVQNTGFRTIPDVSFDASVNSPVTIGFQGSLFYGIAGTSLACPCWGGLMAIVNQGRVAIGGQTFNSTENPTQVLQALYSLPSADFHDITVGYNGFAAGPGYDESTGIGSPIVNLLVPDLVSYGNADILSASVSPPSNVVAGVGFGLTVAIETPNGLPVSTYNGPVTIALGNDPGQTILGGTLTVTAVNGVATFSGLTLDTTGIGYTIVLTATGLTTGTTAAFNVIAAAPAKLVISSGPPSTVTAGALFGLIATVEDAFGNAVAADSGSVTLAIGSNPGSSTLGGTLTVTTVNGVATFSGLSMTKAGTGYTLTLSRGGLTGATSRAFAVNPSTAQQLVLLQPPTSGIVAGTLFSLDVAIEDLYGNPESVGTGSPVTATLITGAGPLQGTTTVTTTNGIAAFSNLSDTKAGPIVLYFGTPSLTGYITSYIIISPAAASQLVVQQQPSATASAGHPFSIQPVIYEEDTYGNLISSDSSSVVTVSLSSGSGPLLGSTTAVITNGAAKFTNLQDNTGETIKLKFALGTMRSVISNSIVVSKLLPTIAITAAPITTTYKQSTTFTVAVGPASGGPAPSGTVTFLDGSTVLGVSTINASGHATFTTSALALGTQSITASYSGDSVNGSATSKVSSVYVSDLASNDFDGDGKSDEVVFGYNPAYGKYGFTIATSSSGFKTTTFYDNNGYGYGNAQSIPVVGDFFGDGRDSYALWTPNSLGGMTFTAVSPVSGKGITANFGSGTDLPVVANVDGDGKADFGIYGYQAGLGYRFDFLTSSSNFSQQYVFNNGTGYGSALSIPLVADFDGSGKANFGLYTPTKTGATFSYIDPSNGTNVSKTITSSLVTANDIPVAVDYDGDGKADLALFGPTPSNSSQYRYLVLTAASGFNPSQAVTFNNSGYGYGNSSSIPVMANYEGTGKFDFALFTPDFNGGEEFVYQTGQTGAGVISDYATLTELPVDAPTYLLAKKVRGH